MENLSQFFHATTKDKLLDTYTMDGIKSVTHLVFADDVLCFTKASPKSLQTLKNILHDFSMLTSMNINWKKSRIFLSASCGEDPTLLEILGCPLKPLLMKQLGVPMVWRQL